MAFPIEYTSVQMAEVQDFIDTVFGNGEEGMIGHDIKSEYVHTDIASVTTDEGDRCFASFGMAAREMNAPHPDFCRAELLMYASKNLSPTSEEAMILMGEIQGISKYPFENNVWLFHGHTISASKRFSQTFGFDAFALVEIEEAENISGIGTVPFLQLVPIYKEEREWIMETGTVEGYILLYKVFGDRLNYADSRREKYIPDEQTLNDLKEFIKTQRENT